MADVLFPFAEARLEAACARASEDERIRSAIDLLRAEHDGSRGDAEYARFLMSRDRKSTGLKALQGVIWEEGYRSGELRATVFDDVPEALRAWRRAGIRVRIYSSGSILAQKLLFAHTDHGDLTGLLEGYHDTTTGPKKETGSYRTIADDMALPAGEILFLSDSLDELDAARSAGMKTGLARRPGNAPVRGDHGHPVFETFGDLYSS